VIELVINAPHRQTRVQRLVAMMINPMGWLLWSYFLFPLFSSTCWFLDFNQCSQWVSLAGGYPNLQAILLNYLATVGVMVCVMLVWVGYNRATVRSRPAPTPRQRPVSRGDLCLLFNVSKGALKQCQESRFVVVHFDQQGHIVELEKA
jgi:poly-beta-1,6-N-acetyl-D-glucosamine biosynthesis protein PgaD